MHHLGVEPRFQEPESCVRSITLRVPITVINYSRDSENGKGLKQKIVKTCKVSAKKVKKVIKQAFCPGRVRKKLAYGANSVILRVSREKWRLKRSLVSLIFLSNAGQKTTTAWSGSVPLEGWLL